MTRKECTKLDVRVDKNIVISTIQHLEGDTTIIMANQVDFQLQDYVPPHKSEAVYTWNHKRVKAT